MSQCIICGTELIKKYNESKNYFKKKTTCSRRCFHKKLGKLLLGRYVGKETRRLIGLKNKGKIVSEETRKKQSEYHLKNKTFEKENHSNWNGGKSKTWNGYSLIRISKGYYRREHRVIMEEHLGRKLTPEEMIHHINGIKTDNRIENLQILTKSEHAKLHYSLRSQLTK